MAPAGEGPEVVGRYLLFGAIARGGMGTVHLGRLLGEEGFAKTVAIKRLHPHLAAEAPTRASFVAEAKLASRIHHANVVQVLDVVREGADVLLVLEYVHGASLARVLELLGGGLVPPRVATAILCDVLAGLHAAHEARDERGEPLRIVHRDVSPQNVIVGVDGIARVLDFGIARSVGRGGTTRDGVLKGKLHYMAPEQLCGEAATTRSDVYAAGVVLWETLTSRPLFEGPDPVVMSRIVHAPVAPPSEVRSDLGASFDDVVAVALAKSPEDRFLDARAMENALSLSSPRATPAELAEWLRGVVGSDLDARAATIATIEQATPRSSVAAQAAPADGHTSPAPAAPVSRRNAGAAAAAVVVVVVVGLAAVRSRPPRATSTTSGPAEGVVSSASHAPASNEPRAASAPASVTSPPPAASTTRPPRAESSARVKSPARAKTCDPPFRLGPSGEKIWIRECF